MKRLLFRLVAGGATLSLCSCLGLILPASPRRVPFNEAEFAPYGRTGSGAVSGQIRQKDEGTSVANSKAYLFPDNAYTQEYVERVFVRGQNLRRADRRADKYEREARVDEGGNFAFRDVPPGKYYIASQLMWSDGVFDQTNSDGSFTLVPMYGSRWIYAGVSVRNGQTVRVENWREGR